MKKRRLMLDPTALSVGACLRRLAYTVAHGYRQAIMTNDIEYGSAFHKFVETYVLTGDAGKALMEAHQYYVVTPMAMVKPHLDSPHLALTCQEYLTQFPKRNALGQFKRVVDKSKRPLMETEFAVPFFEGNNIEVYLCGTIDEILLHEPTDQYIITDWKTTSYWNISEYLENYRVSPQLRIYALACLLMAERWPNSIWTTITKKPMAAMIYGAFLHKDKPTKFVQSDVFFYSEHHLKEVHTMITDQCIRLDNIDLDRPKPEGFINGACIGKFGRCNFFLPCSMPDRASEDIVLARDYVVRNYNPLEFRKK